MSADRCEACAIKTSTTLVVIGDEPFIVCDDCATVADLETCS